VVFSRFKPVRVLRGSPLGAGRSSSLLRRILVVFQFTTSIALITATIIVQRQIDFVSQDRLGFDKERLVALHSAELLEDSYPAFRDAVLADAGVESVTTTTNVPGQVQYNHYGVRPKGAGDDDRGEMFYMLYTNIDFDFVETMGLQIDAGRNLSSEFGTDADDAMLVNESAARKMGWDEPLGQELFGRTVVGVVSDYLSTYSKNEVDAAAFVPTAGAARFVVVRLAPGWDRSTLDFLSETWASFVPSAPAELSFVDADIEALYRSEERLARVFTSFSLLAVLIACLGLFGLAAFSVERRRREIGIRKVLGASLASIVSLLSREYVALVAISLLIGGWTAWAAMDRWLSDYAYRIDLGIDMPLLAGAAALVVALGTVGLHAVRAALADPVDSLRTD
jgi:putative ABC transport system permease protein